MSTYFFLSFGLISFLLLGSFISCSSIFSPINTAAHHQDDRYSPMIISGEEDTRFLSPNDFLFNRNQRSPSTYPRANRNAWFRVSSYQHFKPSRSDETPNGDHLMRWGR